jgi:hypothetical protein
VAVRSDELEPYYDEAERLLHVNRFANEPQLQALVDKIAQWLGLARDALPLGLKPEILGTRTRPSTSTAMPRSLATGGRRAQPDRADRAPAQPHPADQKKVTALLHEPGAPEHIAGVVCRDGSYYRADRVVLAAGAMTSPRILQDHLAASGLDATLACAAMVGANFKLHSTARCSRSRRSPTTTCCARRRSSSTTAIRIRPCSVSAGWTARSSRRSCPARCPSS